MNTLLVAHAPYFTSFWAGVIDFCQGLLAAIQPTVAVVVPLVLTALARRWVNDKTIADAMATAAGVAYNHMGTLRSLDPKILLEQAKQAGIEAGAAAINDAVLKHMSNITPEELNVRIDGALGKLLASDPTYTVAPKSAVVVAVPIPVVDPVA